MKIAICCTRDSCMKIKENIWEIKIKENLYTPVKGGIDKTALLNYDHFWEMHFQKCQKGENCAIPGTGAI